MFDIKKAVPSNWDGFFNTSQYKAIFYSKSSKNGIYTEGSIS
jgi:hypothetical protein